MKCYGFAIENGYGMRFKDYTDILSQVFEDSEGMIGVYPHMKGTMLFFDTVDHAKQTRNLFDFYNLRTGKYIMDCEQEEDGSVTVLKVHEEESFS